MKKGPVASLSAGIASLVLLFAPSASAATEFGDTCVANDSTNEALTFFELSAPGNPLPPAAPTAGVITQWKVNITPAAPPGIPVTMKLLRLDTAASTALVIGESSGSTTGPANVFPARIPVQPGDRLGLFGPKPIGNLLCNVPEEVVIGAFSGGGTPGAPTPYLSGSAPVRIPVAATIEPDADNDGFGDETQDGCPQSPATQAACPVVALDAFAIAGGSAVKVLIATSTTAPVKVTGTAKLGKGATAKLSTKAKTVTAGKIVSFRLPLPAALKKRLKELEPSKKLTLKITASATNVAGQVFTDKLSAKLKGQG